jgi:nucleoside-diphosphate-sugar epimerase
MTKVLITGINGFVGKALGVELVANGFNVNGAVRSLASIDFPDGISQFAVKDIDSTTNWQKVLEGVDVVIHLAARVHMMNDAASSALEECRRVNVEGTLNLAHQAEQAGVRRFIFISSIKVNGEGTRLGQAYTEADRPAPVDPYGISKREAEDLLRQLASERSMEVVIIRPPLVYGPGVKANFQSMMHWLDKPIPLPLGALHNQRSLVALNNLIDLIITCIHHPAAANQTFLVSDGEDVSTTQLLQRMAKALGKKAWLVPVPERVLMLGASLFGKQAIAQRLCGSLQVGIAKASNLLGWAPPVSMDDALNKTAQHFITTRKC